MNVLSFLVSRLVDGILPLFDKSLIVLNSSPEKFRSFFFKMMNLMFFLVNFLREGVFLSNSKKLFIRFLKNLGF